MSFIATFFLIIIVNYHFLLFGHDTLPLVNSLSSSVKYIALGVRADTRSLAYCKRGSF